MIERAVAERGVRPDTLTLGTDNGSAYTSRSFRARLADWREEFETLAQARQVIGAYINNYHHRPHSGLNYRTPREVAATWQDHQDQQSLAA